MTQKNSGIDQAIADELSGDEGNATLAPYNIGYKKPPAHSRFKPGRSGNPKGRPSKRRAMAAVLREFLEKPLEIKDGGRIRRMQRREALVHNLYSKAMKGDPRAVTAFILLMRQCGYANEVEEQVATLVDEGDFADLLQDYLARNPVAPGDGQVEDEATETEANPVGSEIG